MNRHHYQHLFHGMEMDYIYSGPTVLKREEINRGQEWPLREVWRAQKV